MTEKPESQQDKIIRTAQEVFYLPAEEAGELAFMSKCFIQATLPHSDPGKVEGWGRRSGDYSLSIQPGGYLDDEGKWISAGVPYGSIPRLILAWLNAEVLKTGSRELSLGKSYSEYLRKLGYKATGGVKGDMTRVRNQSQRLFSSKISLMYRGSGKMTVANALLADYAEYFWDPVRPEQQSLWESKIVLSEQFFKVLKSAPVPLDWRVLKSLKQSPMALDLYMWLSYRMFSLKQPQKIKWETLSLQFGSQYKTIKGFRENVRKHLRKVQSVWQDLNLDLEQEETLTLYPSSLLIAPKELVN
jgi:Plasmid encoded RepA protein